jgi:hypothetical protein
MKTLVGGLLGLLLLAGCAPQQQMYYWGDYSESLYSLKKNPSEESMAKHVETLEAIIQNSQELDKRVPPGIYGELGYYMARQGKAKKAENYFLKEEEVYPESKKLMTDLIAQLDSDQGTQGGEK